MIHGSLFSGIGGFDLAAEWMGWENAFHCEWNPFGQKVLKHYWPEAESYEDITKTDFTKWRGAIDILTGGFPCQPYSTAGKRKGKEDDRHLWPEMLRAIQEIKPRIIVGENVSGIISWNRGLVFHEVQTDLEAEGYKVQPVLLPACAVNAPHRRDRVWFIAYSKSQQSKWVQSEQRESSNTEQGEFRRNSSRMGNGFNPHSYNLLHKRELDTRGDRGEEKGSEGENQFQWQTSHRERIWSEPSTSSKDASNPERKRQQEQGQPERSLYTKADREWKASWSYNDGRWPTQPPVCGRNDGFSSQLDNITFPKWRRESIKAFGNAIVPQVAFQIFKAVEQVDKNFKI